MLSVTNDQSAGNGQRLRSSIPIPASRPSRCRPASAGSYGTFNLGADGAWTYKASNSQTAIQSLGAGQTLTDSFTAVSSDGTASKGRHSDNHWDERRACDRWGVDRRSVTEDASSPLTTSGTAHNCGCRRRSVDLSRYRRAQLGTYGTFTLGANGAWTYTASNSQTAIQSLGAGQTLADSFTAVSSDGTATKVVTVTINGTNDVPVIGGTSTGAVTEDASSPLTTSGMLTIADVDAGQSTFTVQASTTGTYGTFTLGANGAWTYTASNSQTAIQSLGAGQTLADSFTAVSSDGTATKVVTVTINGTNDAAVIGGTLTGTVTEAGGVANNIPGTPTATGTVTATDIDSPATFVAVSSATSSANGYGKYKLTANGAWTYNLDNLNSAVQALNAGQTLTDKFSVVTADGTSRDVVITINGANDTNTSPVVSATLVQSLHVGTIAAASSLFSVNDVDGDVITRYRFVDATTGAGSFSVGSVTQAAFTFIEISAAQLAQTTFTATPSRGTYDTLYVSAYDGVAWSAYTQFYVIGTNTAPTVTAPSNTNVAKFSTTPLSNLLTGSDADGDALTIYQFYDANVAADSGSILLNGVTQAAGTIITATASQVTNGQAAFLAGSGADDLLVRAYDGSDFGAWTQFRVTAPINHAPVTSATYVQSLHVGTTVAVSSLFAASDADADTITRYRFVDATTGAGSFSVGSVTQAAFTFIEISAAQLAQTTFTATPSRGTYDTLYVSAYDGVAWSAYTQFYVIGTNTAPTVTAPSNTNVAKFSTTPLSNLLTGSDADGDALTIYQFYDANAAADSGSILLNGVTQAAGTIITATASQVTNGQAAFRAGSGADDLLVRAYDGSDFGAWTQFRVTAPINHAPVTTATSPQSLQSGSSIPVSTLFSVTDSDADPITAYQFYDATPGAGSFSIGGVAQAANMLIDVSSSQLAQTAFTPGAAGTADSLYVRAYDGLAWSGFSQFVATSHS